MESLQTPQTSQGNPASDEISQPPDWKRAVLDILETLILAVVLYFGINAVSARVRVDGFSMNPSLANGEYILVNKLAYRFGQPSRGDIIVFSFPLDPQQDLIKRVIGLPGETVTVRDGHVFINDVELSEPYIAESPLYNDTQVVGENELYVLGDNRNASKDSHEWGLLPVKNIVGKAILIYWPPPRWEIIDHVQPASAAQ